MDAKPFAHELALLSEPAQRDAKLVERLRELPVPAVVELLHDLVILAEAADLEARIALQCCVGLTRFEPELGYERIADIYVVADDCGYEEVKLLVSNAEVKRRAPKDSRENDHLERALGERTALARSTRDRDLLDRLIHDRNPKVIQNLLLNARLIEVDVVRIAAQRPSTPAVLHEILRSAKWSTRYGVKKALALNPYFPVGEAATLLPMLTGPDLEQISTTLDLAEAVRDAAREILARRRPSSSSEEAN